ncbi:MAG: DUF711 family protein [Pseudomonadota bacterium]
MIRAVTLGLPLFDVPLAQMHEAVRDFLNSLDALVVAREWPLRTTRFCLPPLPPSFETNAGSIPAFIRSVASISDTTGVRWFCLPVDLSDGSPHKARLDALMGALLREERLFANLIVAGQNQIATQGARSAAEFILGVSRKSRKGYDNFRVGASCGCLPNTPFFPFSRHEGIDLAFSLALETAEIALDLARQQKSLEIFHAEFIDLLTERLLQMDKFANELSAKTGVRYAGLDCSLAPFPDGETSIGRLLELLGAEPFGSQGTVFLTSVLTDALKTAMASAGVRTTGFNGVMYSVLEDDVLAKATRRRRLDISALNLYSTVCGCGLDMVPIPGDVLVEDIQTAILDTATLATRLCKPLGVRLLPIPERTLNEITEFNMEFLCDARVMKVAGSDSDLVFDKTNWSYDNLAATGKAK